MLKTLIGLTGAVVISGAALAQEAKRSELELLFLRPAEHAGKEIKLQGRLNNARPEGAVIYLKADRLGNKSLGLIWKAPSGMKWEEIQLVCSYPAKDPRCEKVAITGTFAETLVPGLYEIKGADYEFIK